MRRHGRAKRPIALSPSRKRLRRKSDAPPPPQRRRSVHDSVRLQRPLKQLLPQPRSAGAQSIREKELLRLWPLPRYRRPTADDVTDERSERALEQLRPNA